MVPERRGRGPDLQPRAPRVRVLDRAVGEATEDWTAFDINQSMRMLRTGTDAQITRELRKLHIRWWHATRTQMEKILHAAGVPREVLQRIPAIVDTCRECRAWQRPGPDVTPSVDLVMQQNEQVEGDLLFYKDYIVWHMVDRADRWHAATVVPDKSAPTLCAAIMTTWIQIFGPFRFLVIDGERGLTIAEEAKDFFKTHGIQVRERAPGQHARYVERRGAILRHALHCAEEQFEREGLRVTFPELLAQAVFAGNALVTYNGATLYNARFGTQPALLPDIHAHHADSILMNGRHPHRVREIALQRIIESTA